MVMLEWTAVKGTKRYPVTAYRIIAGLSSGVVHEFKVASLNSVGVGQPGPASPPVRLPRYRDNEPDDRLLLSAETVQRLRARQAAEAEAALEKTCRVVRRLEITKHVKVRGLGDETEEQGQQLGTLSGYTPRLVDGTLNTEQATHRTSSELFEGAAANTGADATTASPSTDVAELKMVPESGDTAPPASWCDDPTNSDYYQGEWAPFLVSNDRTLRHWLPDKYHPSDHLLLAADLRFDAQECAATVPLVSTEGRK
ncbi:hypothetical protein JKP88DRAFT_327838 [Tribonema minus]|uniref:Uncharacterized protein n=1 Tax=Tribonema minus TaxID=303371 RepID=A0A836CAF0_9STRA|nr:hypothetical protein JKP88DRAFT_327838 [Tribonema minus]